MSGDGADGCAVGRVPYLDILVGAGGENLAAVGIKCDTGNSASSVCQRPHDVTRCDVDDARVSVTATADELSAIRMEQDTGYGRAVPCNRLGFGTIGYVIQFERIICGSGCHLGSVRTKGDGEYR